MNDNTYYAVSNLETLKDSIDSYATYSGVRDPEFYDLLNAAQVALQRLIDHIKEGGAK